MMSLPKPALPSLLLPPLALLPLLFHPSASYDYLDALGKSVMFYEGQRSGRLPSSQRLAWRGNSALGDGHAQGVDLTGGYYDAGDNVKFGLPMAFTITMLSWSVIEYGDHMEPGGHLSYGLDAIRWGTDYLLKAHSEPDVLWGEVGDGNTDHYCWQRPEDMTTSRKAYRIDPASPGSDLAGETAAAMAAASIVFRSRDYRYASRLSEHARQLFTFANTYRGKYDNSITAARSYYQSRSGYADELLWAAMWLYQATSEEYYLKYVVDNAGPLGGIGWAMTEFSWDVKYAGVQVLAAKVLMQGNGEQYFDVLEAYQSKAEYFLCGCLQKNSWQNVHRTPGGLMYWRSWNNIQYVTSASFLLTVYSDYLSSTARQRLKCSAGSAEASELMSLARSQIDYILGNNPRGTSYMIGFGSNYPQRVHHRAASIISYKVDPSFVSCRGGYATWFSRHEGDPNVLVGAVVGGPDQDDNYADDRENYEQSEPATYNNAPLVGVLARLHGGGYAQLYPVKPAKPAPTITNPVTPETSATSLGQNVEGSEHPQPPAHRHPDAAILVSQRLTTSWSFRGLRYYRYVGQIVNASPHYVNQLVISIDGLYGPIWGLSKAEGKYYSFPSWLQHVPPQARISFVYIQPAAQAKVSVLSANFT